MDLSLIDKLNVIFKYIFSSFLSIEMFIISLLLFIILVINIKKKNYIIQIIALGIYIGFIFGIFISNFDYVKYCIDSFVKKVMNYIYFPSTIVYFFIMIFCTIMIIYTLYSKKMTTFKKVFNYIFFSILYYMFMSFITLCTYEMVDLLDVPKLYENNVILSIVQVSNFILLIWIIFTCFYHLFLFFKRKYD